MTEEDARFEDARAAPLRLRAFDAEDLRVISTLTQDSIFPGNEVSWRPKQHRFAPRKRSRFSTAGWQSSSQASSTPQWHGTSGSSWPHPRTATSVDLPPCSRRY
jgi:hypothetical protein